MKKISLMDLQQEVTGLHDLGLNALSGGGFDIHPDGHYFRASSAGMCMRKAMFAYLQCKQIPRAPESRRTLYHGTKIHEWADKAVDMIVWKMGGSIIRMVPYRLAAFNHLFSDSCILGADVCVNGTLDHLYLAFTDDGMKLVIVDHKSANEYAFKRYKRDGAAAHHRAQVGTYHSAIMPLVHALGLKSRDVYTFMAYISKKDLEVHVSYVDHAVREAAENYWGNVAGVHREMFDTTGAMKIDAALPAAQPFEKWECNYCDYCSNHESCCSITTVRDLETVGMVSHEFVVANEGGV